MEIGNPVPVHSDDILKRLESAAFELHTESVSHRGEAKQLERRAFRHEYLFSPEGDWNWNAVFNKGMTTVARNSYIIYQEFLENF